MYDRNLIRYFWDCGDNDIIEFALIKARLNRKEKEVIVNILDECMTQEQVAEKIDISTRQTQRLWCSACDKLLAIPWVFAYAEKLRNLKE